MFNDSGCNNSSINIERQILDVRMDALEFRLINVFKDKKVDQNIQGQIAEIIAFFRKKASLIEEYKAFVTILESVQIAENQSDAVAEALNNLNKQIPDRQQHLQCLNIGAVIGVVVLTLIGLTAIAGAIFMGLALSTFPPIMGIGWAIALSVFGVAALAIAAGIFGSMTPTTELEKEINREKNLLSFFIPKNQGQNIEPEPTFDSLSQQFVEC